MASSTALLSCLMYISLLFTSSEARYFLVGGKTNAWQIPSNQSSSSDSLNRWAEANRFQTGDSLVWKFDGEKDSVLQVTRKDYKHCKTSDPIAAYKGGNVTVKLERSGPFYFISGEEGNCEKGEKLIVVVLSDRKRIAISPAPSPMEFDGPAIAPTSAASGLSVLRSAPGLVVGVLGGLMAMLL